MQDAEDILKPTLGAQSLETLVIQQCENATAVIRLCADDEQLLPSVKAVTVTAATEGSYNVDAMAINLLLLRLDGLTEITLALGLSSPFAHCGLRGLQAKAIAKHAETLRYLYLDVAIHDEELFVRRLQSCRQLVQAAIPNFGQRLVLSQMHTLGLQYHPGTLVGIGPTRTTYHHQQTADPSTGSFKSLDTPAYSVPIARTEHCGTDRKRDSSHSRTHDQTAMLFELCKRDLLAGAEPDSFWSGSKAVPCYTSQ